MVALDEWLATTGISKIDLIKADVEGAELFLLEGARLTIERHHPRLLLQAYHIVDGSRTFERCAQILERFDYAISEPTPGLLYAV